MKRLVLGALLAIAASAGCGTSASDTLVVMNWQFTHLANNQARSCPTNFGTASVIAQATDPVTYLPTGRTIVEKYDCATATGKVSVSDGTWIVWVQIENAAGTNIYAKSAQTFVDTLDGDTSIDVEILDDGGYFFLTWDLVDAVSQAPLSCRSAGVTSNGAVEAISTSMANHNAIITDKFTCQDHFGTTAGLVAGQYVVSVHAEENNNPVGDDVTSTTKTITAPNGLTDLGHFVLPID